jgi:NIPSNAP
MMDRRAFMTLSGVTGAAALGALGGTAAAQEARGRDVYELRQYHVETEAQKAGLVAFMRDAAIPALNRIGVSRVGLFEPAEELGPVYVLMCHDSMASVATVTGKLGADSEFMAKGAAFLDAPAENPAYARMESSVLAAFTGMPKLEKPSDVPGRVFQLRIYESPSVKTGQKKIEMFNTAEIAIFRKVGLNPVFFGEALAGAKMPNLTYMLGFDSMDEQKAAWAAFGADPDWLNLRAMPEYSDKKILCGITNLSLKPVEGSQV